MAATLAEIEKQAIIDASEAIGGYLESIGVTDIAAMSAEQWHGFIGHAYSETCNAVQARLAATGEVPF